MPIYTHETFSKLNILEKWMDMSDKNIKILKHSTNLKILFQKTRQHIMLCHKIQKDKSLVSSPHQSIIKK